MTSEKDDIARFLPRNRLWPEHREEPLGIRELPEVELWTAKMRHQAVGIFHFGDLPLIRRKANRIQREGGRLVLNFECILVHLHGHLFSSQPIFPKEFPVLKFDVAVFVASFG